MAGRNELKKPRKQAPRSTDEATGEMPESELAGHLLDVVVAAKCIAALVEHIALKIDGSKQETPNNAEVKG
jgi:hypothetical protein